MTLDSGKWSASRSAPIPLATQTPAPTEQDNVWAPDFERRNCLYRKETEPRFLGHPAWSLRTTLTHQNSVDISKKHFNAPLM